MYPVLRILRWRIPYLRSMIDEYVMRKYEPIPSPPPRLPFLLLGCSVSM